MIQTDEKGNPLTYWGGLEKPKQENLQLPDWFNGTVYEKGEVVINPFSGEEYELNNIELSMYDFINGCSMLYELRGSLADDLIYDWRRGLDWFKDNSPKAYMVLLD